MNAPLPGWYPDAGVPGGLRWWDGRGWTSDVVVPCMTAFAPPKPPFPTLPLPVATGALVCIAAPLVVSRLLLEHIVGRHSPVWVYFLVAGLLAYGPGLVWWAFASRRWGRGRPRDDVGLLFRPVDLGAAPLTWISALAAQVAVASVVLALRIPFTGNVEGVRQSRDRLDVVLPIVVLAVLVAPVVEEILFRGLVMRGLASAMPPAAAIGLQGVLFGAAHFDPSRGMGNVGLIMVLSAVGVVFGIAAYLTRRLAPSIGAHIIVNAIAVGIALSGWSPASQ